MKAQNRGWGSVFVQRAKKRPHAKRNCERQHDIRDQNASEQEQPNAGGHAEACIKSCPLLECPRAEGGCHSAESNRRQGNRNPRDPIMGTKNHVRDGDGPVDQRSLFQIHDAIEPRRNPVAGSEHVTRDLRLHGIHVIHEGGRRNDAAQINGACNQQND